MVDRIRIDTGVKKILINDGPDYIEFNPSDITFAEKFYQLIKDFEVKEADFSARAQEIDANTATDPHGLPENTEAGLALMREICDFTRSRIDVLFGEGTSQKLFGSALSLNMFEQFFVGITPYIRAARVQKIEKYIPHPKKKK